MNSNENMVYACPFCGSTNLTGEDEIQCEADGCGASFEESSRIEINSGDLVICGEGTESGETDFEDPEGGFKGEQGVFDCPLELDGETWCVVKLNDPAKFMGQEEVAELAQGLIARGGTVSFVVFCKTVNKVIAE